jgi:predicted N-acetyltransferase YhbS
MHKDIQIRSASLDDAHQIGAIIYESFKAISEQHGYQQDFASCEEAVSLAVSLIKSSQIYGVVACVDEEIIGSNFLDERQLVKGLGPISVASHAQKKGVGRTLMLAAINHAGGNSAIRLTQAAFNLASLSLYSSLGFIVREPLVVMEGRLNINADSQVEVRPMTVSDLTECNLLCKNVYGFSRGEELHEAISNLNPLVACRAGKIIAYACDITSWASNHSVAANEEDMQALLTAIATKYDKDLSFLVGTRGNNMFHWCLDHGFKATFPRTLMTKGDYQPPKGCYFPSVLY